MAASASSSAALLHATASRASSSTMLIWAYWHATAISLLHRGPCACSCATGPPPPQRPPTIPSCKAARPRPPGTRRPRRPLLVPTDCSSLLSNSKATADGDRHQPDLLQEQLPPERALPQRVRPQTLQKRVVFRLPRREDPRRAEQPRQLDQHPQADAVRSQTRPPCICGREKGRCECSASFRGGEISAGFNERRI